MDFLLVPSTLFEECCFHNYFIILYYFELWPQVKNKDVVQLPELKLAEDEINVTKCYHS